MDSKAVPLGVDDPVAISWLIFLWSCFILFNADLFLFDGAIWGFVCKALCFVNKLSKNIIDGLLRFEALLLRHPKWIVFTFPLWMINGVVGTIVIMMVEAPTDILISLVGPCETSNSTSIQMTSQGTSHPYPSLRKPEIKVNWKRDGF